MSILWQVFPDADGHDTGTATRRVPLPVWHQCRTATNLLIEMPNLRRVAQHHMTLSANCGRNPRLLKDLEICPAHCFAFHQFRHVLSNVVVCLYMRRAPRLCAGSGASSEQKGVRDPRVL